MSGFITTDAIPSQYGLGDTKTRRRGLNNSFFVGASVKSIGESYHSQSGRSSTELAALWGSCGRLEVKA